MARPIEYIEGIHDAWAESLAIEGLTDSEIAKRMNIARSTLYKWKNDFSTFSDALKSGKEPADAKVKLSLFKRAIGYTVNEKKVIVELDAEGNQKPARIETTTKHIVPDTIAQIFWLKNRLPEDWRDKKDVDLGGNMFLQLMKEASANDK